MAIPENLNHVFLAMEGHYTRGFGDRSQAPRIRLMPGADEEAAAFLADHPNTRERMRKVAQLVSGWETPYSLELLATVHWALEHEADLRRDRATLYEYVATWTPRKAKLFEPLHIDQAGGSPGQAELPGRAS